MGDNNMILYILKLFFKPITTFKKYNDNLDDSKNCIFLTILILILMTLGYLFVKAADCVVTYPVCDYGYTLNGKTYSNSHGVITFVKDFWFS